MQTAVSIFGSPRGVTVKLKITVTINKTQEIEVGDVLI
jgi:hypothetical protein